MSDLPFSDPEVLPAEVPPTAQPAKKKPRWRLMLLIIGLIVVCLGGAAAAALVVRQILQNPVETQGFELAVDKFMAAASRRDAEAAFGFLSPDGQKQIPRPQLEKMLHSREYALFSDFRSVSITSFHDYLLKDSGAGQQQVETVVVTGVVTYDSSYLGQLKAILQKLGGEWMIFSIEVTVPPGKYGGVSSG